MVPNRDMSLRRATICASSFFTGLACQKDLVKVVRGSTGRLKTGFRMSNLTGWRFSMRIAIWEVSGGDEILKPRRTRVECRHHISHDFLIFPASSAFGTSCTTGGSSGSGAARLRRFGAGSGRSGSGSSVTLRKMESPRTFWGKWKND